jgi:hypothetical protein
MRDVVKVPCLPHNYRHGKASLLYHRYPDRLAYIAEQLGDTERTVIECYAWVHNEKAMAEGQRLVCGPHRDVGGDGMRKDLRGRDALRVSAELAGFGHLDAFDDVKVEDLRKLAELIELAGWPGA